MIDLIAAALLAATPAPAPAAGTQPANAHAQHQHQTGQHEGHKPGQPGTMTEMKDCCCKDKMAKMHQSHSAQQDPVR